MSMHQEGGLQRLKRGGAVCAPRAAACLQLRAAFCLLLRPQWGRPPFAAEASALITKVLPAASDGRPSDKAAFTALARDWRLGLSLA
jgi:hypothetical protein